MSLSEMIEAFTDALKEEPSKEMILKEENGKFLLDGIELPLDHPEEWGPIIISKVARRYLKNG
jgi:hypothetical protein